MGDDGGSQCSSAAPTPTYNSAMALIQELRDNPDVIPPYNRDSVQDCAQKITELYNANLAAIMDLKSGKCQQQDQAITMVKVRQTTIEQIKRCCCAYLNERMKRLKGLRWKSSGHVSAEVRAALSDAEKKWLATYNQLVFTFQSDFGQQDDNSETGGGFNLLNHIQPPKSLMVQVRALKNWSFETSEGQPMTMKKNHTYFLPRQDCENLVNQGVLEYNAQV